MTDTVQTKRGAAIVGSASWMGLPKPPPLPEQLINRFPELRHWQEQHDRWWENFVGALHQRLVGRPEN